MSGGYEIVDIDDTNVEEYNLFCKKSKSKTEPYRQKLEWFRARLKEGLRYRLLLVDENGRMASRGFIEYIPGEYAWRAIDAVDYDVIHCLWVTGKHKKKGHGSRLLGQCLEECKDRGSRGVAVVTSSRVWMAGSNIFTKTGFEKADEFPPFELLVKKFDDAPDPSFPTNWDERASRYGEGLTVVRASQCPFVQDAEDIVADYAGEKGIPFKAVELKTAKEVREKAPSPYGIFNIVHDGKLISYHYLLKKDLDKVFA